MAILFCSHCRTLLRLQGRMARCPKCGHQQPLATEAVGPRVTSDSKWMDATERTPSTTYDGPTIVRNDRCPYFPYKARAGQEDLMSLVYRTLLTRGHLVVESATGTGKTICVLSAALQFCEEHEKRLIYLTRTNSQAKQVMAELRSINRLRPVLGVAMQGRRNTCQLMRKELQLGQITSAELPKLCEQRKRHTVAKKKGGCTFYENLVSYSEDQFVNYAKGKIPTAEEFIAFCEDKGACAHEAMKDVASKARLVIAPYSYLISREIRESFFAALGTEPENAVVIVDEAHNLLDFARDSESFSLDLALIEAAKTEWANSLPPSQAKLLDVPLLAKCLVDAVQKGGSLALKRGEAPLPKRFLEQMVEEKGEDLGDLLEISTTMRKWGEGISDLRASKGELPYSSLSALGEILSDWASAREERYVKYASAAGPKLHAYCMDPVEAFSVFTASHASVHMSGTLRPLRQYASTIGLTDATQRCVPSPFPKENRIVLYVDDVTTEYGKRGDPGNASRMEGHISNIANATYRKSMVFFPSFEQMKFYLDRGLKERIESRVFQEEAGMRQERLMREVAAFKDQRGPATFLTVMGGRVAEGLDFPEEELEVAIIVGIPYPPPTIANKALEQWSQQRFGMGWEYASKAPAARRILQAIGRLIRTETDVGAAVILDSRAPQFREYLEMRHSCAPAAEVVNFFASKEIDS